MPWKAGTSPCSTRATGRRDSPIEFRVASTPDVTALCLDDRPLEEDFVDLEVGGAGRLVVCPARAPLECLARAKTPGAAAAFGDWVDEAARAFDCVLVETPLLAAN